MDNKRHELLKSIQSDPFGLLDSPQKTKQLNESTALLNSFEEIVDFVEQNDREPISELNNIQEFQLFARLQSIRSDPSKVKLLKPYDLHNLLEGQMIKEMTINDIIADDKYGLLDYDKSDIFNLVNVKKTDRLSPDYLSRRTFCKNFDEYKDMFDTIHDELKNKKRKLALYNSSHLAPGNFYVLGGILLFLKEVDGQLYNFDYESGERNRFDGRTTIIFDNGTQSDMLFRSLDKALQKDGYAISNFIDNATNSCVNECDIQNGYIYIIKTKNSQFAYYQDLYKIGCTTSTVQDRIKNSKHQATYLFSDVDIISVKRCYNVQPVEIEKKIHSFFNKVRLDIDIVDANGMVYKPKEWFIVNKCIIDEAITLILNNTISQYFYDSETKQILNIK